MNTPCLKPSRSDKIELIVDFLASLRVNEVPIFPKNEVNKIKTLLNETGTLASSAISERLHQSGLRGDPLKQLIRAINNLSGMNLQPEEEDIESIQNTQTAWTANPEQVGFHELYEKTKNLSHDLSK